MMLFQQWKTASFIGFIFLFCLVCGETSRCFNNQCCQERDHPNEETGEGYYEFYQECFYGGLHCVGSSGCRVCRDPKKSIHGWRPICNYFEKSECKGTEVNDYLSLPQNDLLNSDRFLQLQINQQTILYKERYEGRATTTLGGPVGDLISESEYLSLLAPILSASAFYGQILSNNAANVGPISSIDDYEKLYGQGLPLPDVFKLDWKSDEYFVKQVLTVKGDIIQKANELHINITNEELSGILKPGKTLQEELANGKIFVSDLRILNQVPVRNKTGSGIPPQYATGCVALWYLNQYEKLVPLAIGGFSSTPLVFTPNDHPNLWLLAKIAFNSASTIFLALNHYSSTHISMEPLKVSVLRTLSESHPIHRLMIHHLTLNVGNALAFDRAILAIDSSYDRTSFFGVDGSFELFLQLYEQWQFKTPPKEFEEKGVQNLPGYLYRDDSLALYHEIKNFVNDYLAIYYHSDEDLANDFELQNWLAESASQGRIRNFPSNIHQLSDLVEILSIVIWNIAVKHHAINTFTVHHFHVPPSVAPLSFYRPLPQSKEEDIDEEDLLGFLPPLPLAADQASIGIIYSLRPVAPFEKLGSSLDGASLGTKSSEAIRKFQKNLEVLSQNIKQREENETVPYLILDPENLPYYLYI